MIAIDTNILIYAHREECPQHKKAYAFLKNLSEGQKPWSIPWPCVYEFLRVVTHPKVFTPPTPLRVALDNIKNLYQSPSLVLLQETDRHLFLLDEVAQNAKIDGNLMFDAHIAVLLIEHGIQEVATTDNDFKRFKDLKPINPVE